MCGERRRNHHIGVSVTSLDHLSTAKAPKEVQVHQDGRTEEDGVLHRYDRVEVQTDMNAKKNTDRFIKHHTCVLWTEQYIVLPLVIVAYLGKISVLGTILKQHTCVMTCILHFCACNMMLLFPVSFVSNCTYNILLFYLLCCLFFNFNSRTADKLSYLYLHKRQISR